MRLAIAFDLLAEDGKPTRTNREVAELEVKLLKLGFAVPWLNLPDGQHS